jgi:hypothetical protein
VVAVPSGLSLTSLRIIKKNTASLQLFLAEVLARLIVMAETEERANESARRKSQR